MNNSGMAFRCPDFGRAVCRLLISSITEHSARFGDSATSLTLMIHAALAHIAALCESDGTNNQPLSAVNRSHSTVGVDSASLARSQQQQRSSSETARLRMQRHITALGKALAHLQTIWFNPAPSASASSATSATPQSLMAEYLQHLSLVSRPSPTTAPSSSTSASPSDPFRSTLMALLRTTFCMVYYF